MISRTLLILLTGVAFAFAACGDDDDGGATKSEFIEKADAICAEGEEKNEQLVRESVADPANPKGSEVLEYLRAAIPLQRDTIEQIRDLEKPEGDEDQINEFLDKVESATDEAERIDDPQKALALVEASDTPADPFYEANKVAEDYGLEECSE